MSVATCSGPKKPIAKKTKSAGQSFSEPGTFSNLPSFISTCTVRTPVNLPASSPMKHTEDIE